MINNPNNQFNKNPCNTLRPNCATNQIVFISVSEIEDFILKTLEPLEKYM
jgi:hypothetical protein